MLKLTPPPQTSPATKTRKLSGFSYQCFPQKFFSELMVLFYQAITISSKLQEHSCGSFQNNSKTFHFLGCCGKASPPSVPQFEANLEISNVAYLKTGFRKSIFLLTLKNHSKVFSSCSVAFFR